MVEKKAALKHGQLVDPEPTESQIVSFLRGESLIDVNFIKPLNNRELLSIRITNRRDRDEAVQSSEIRSIGKSGKINSWKASGYLTQQPESGACLIPAGQKYEIKFVPSIGTFQSGSAESFYAMVVLSDGTIITSDVEITPPWPPADDPSGLKTNT
jgi:hypothetical protein